MKYQPIVPFLDFYKEFLKYQLRALVPILIVSKHTRLRKTSLFAHKKHHCPFIAACSAESLNPLEIILELL